MARSVETFALLVRDKQDNDIFEVIPLSSENGQACVQYPHELIPSLDVLHQAIKGYPESLRKEWYFAYSEGEDITLEGEALYLPDIGNVGLSVDSQRVEWEFRPREEPIYVVLPCVRERVDSDLFGEISRAVIPVLPEHVRRPEPGEEPEFWGVYRNEDDGRQIWMQDCDTEEGAKRKAKELNNEY